MKFNFDRNARSGIQCSDYRLATRSGRPPNGHCPNQRQTNVQFVGQEIIDAASQKRLRRLLWLSIYADVPYESADGRPCPGTDGFTYLLHQRPGSRTLHGTGHYRDASTLNYPPLDTVMTTESTTSALYAHFVSYLKENQPNFV